MALDDSHERDAQELYSYIKEVLGIQNGSKRKKDGGLKKYRKQYR